MGYAVRGDLQRKVVTVSVGVPKPSSGYHTCDFCSPLPSNPDDPAAGNPTASPARPGAVDFELLSSITNQRISKFYRGIFCALLVAMPRWIVVVLASAAVLLDTQFGYAQNTMPFREGARVRVDAPVLPATLHGQARTDPLDSNVFTISTTGNDARVGLPLASTSRIEVSDGRARGKRAKLGATVGLLAGGVVGAWVGRRESRRIATTEGRSAVPVGALVFGGAGGVVGGVLGFAYAPERWRTVYSGTASDTRYSVLLSPGAPVKQLASGAIAVRGERNRRAGMVRGAAALGGLNLVFGGIDHARGNMSGREYASAAFANAVIGAAIGYLISPRGWQELPSPASSDSQ